jgi:ubiquinone/menaquinone biosynthesis C-methylase UbiE
MANNPDIKTAIKAYYERYDEENRLFRSNSQQIEWLTTIHYFDRLFAPGSKILDCCAGTGRYALHLAEQGHIVTAGDLVEYNVELIKTKPGAERLAEICRCDALSMPQFADDSFDVVLCMGALYHLRTNDLRAQAVRESMRVCKPGGMVAFAYITKIGAVLANLGDDLSKITGLMNLLNDTDEGIFFCAYPREIESITAACGLKKLHHIGVDGINQVIRDKLNAASDEHFRQFMEYHLRTCEDESIIGVSTHGLLIGQKQG